MDIVEFAKQLKFKTIAQSMQRLGLDPDSVDDKMEAVSAILEHFAAENLEIEYECESCGGDLPDIDFCPFCGSSLTDGDEDDESEENHTNKSKGIPGELYRGARRGRLPKGEARVAGTKLIARLIGVLGITDDFIGYKKSVTSLWCNWGMFARCFVGAFSVRVHLPFPAVDYSHCDLNGIVIDTENTIKNMNSRLAIESLDEIEDAVEILRQTVLLKKQQAEEKQRLKEVSKAAGD